MSIFRDRSRRHRPRSGTPKARCPLNPAPNELGGGGQRRGMEPAPGWDPAGGFEAHLMAARRAGGAPTGSAPGAPLTGSAGVRGWLQVLLSLSWGPAP